MQHRFPHRQVGCGGNLGNFIQRRIANTAGRIIDGPAQRFFIEWVDGQAQISHQVFHLFPLVKRHAPKNAVWNIDAAQVFLKFPALCVGAVQNRNFRIGNMVAVALFQNKISYAAALFIVGDRFYQFD